MGSIAAAVGLTADQVAMVLDEAKLAIAAQSRWAEISGNNRTHFCGAYWFYGFHEDGLNSALRVAQALGVKC